MSEICESCVVLDKSKVDKEKDANYDDAIIGILNPKDEDKSYIDNSTIYRSVVLEAIDRICEEINSDGYPIIKIRVRSERIPNVGDMFSCYNDQTEVLTDHGWMKFEN